MNPLIGILFRPRKTIQEVIEKNRRRDIFILVMVGGFFAVLFMVENVFWSVVVGPLWGLIGIYVGAWLVWKVSRRLGGEANFVQTQAVAAYAQVPLLWFFPFFIIWKQWFLPFLPFVNNITGKIFLLTLSVSILSIIFYLLNIAALFWSVALYLKCLSEVNKFPIWKAILVLGINALIIGIPILLIIFLTLLVMSIV